jgi:superoxide dismutase, Cu-Zn family
VWRPFVCLAVLVNCLAWPTAAGAQTPTRVPGASADIRNAAGQSIATATLTQAAEEVLISINFHDRNAMIGTHAIHIHSTGQCDAPTFNGAGPIFNPTGKQHGLRNPSGPMAGDLPNLVIGPDGVAVYNLSAPGATLQPGTSSLLGGRGTALVIFAQPDDDQSQPEGNAGQRVACGVITAGATAGSPLSGGNSPDLLTAGLIAAIGGVMIVGGVLLRRGT